MTEKKEYLREIELFQDLSAEEVENVGKQAKMSTYPANHIFYSPGDAGEVLFILKRGRVQLYRISLDGRKLVIATLASGTIFGQMALVGQGLHETFAEAIEECVICSMSRDEVERLLIEKPQVTLRLLDALGKRLLAVEHQLEDMTFKRIPARLAGLLIRLNKENDANGVLTGYTHQFIAEMLGTYRETTTQNLNLFQEQNLIRLGRKTIEILDEVGLEKIASESQPVTHAKHV
ncbi:MAG: Crp/Fnr family transcriptional regulator [Chloroflexi bacterium]|nr:MAG: cyclic nucleotide-binding protein [Phototrophicales bacterium]RMF82528.1 MAG: Crp/Fnr family transcriptional regulator [Chloroflexota bacterium]